MKIEDAIKKFEEARATLMAYVEEHQEVIEEYEVLRSQYNETLDGVKAAYSEEYEKVGPRFGEFKASPRVKVDAQKLLDLLGDKIEPFITTKVTIPAKAYQDAVNAGIIPEDVMKEVETTTISIYGPKKL